VLDLEERTRPAVDPREGRHLERPRAGDVGDVNPLADEAVEQVGQAVLVGVADDEIHLAETRDVLRARLSPAARHDEPCAGAHPGRAPDRLAIGELRAGVTVHVFTTTISAGSPR